MKIGFIGLGIMGTPMCTNLIKKSGHDVYVFDLNASAVAEVVELGATALDSSREIGETCDMIFSMVPKTEHVQAVYQELLPSVKESKVYVDMSTIDPTASANLAKEVKALGGEMVDAPVVKSQPAAVAGTLGIYVGGDEETFKKVLPLLECLGENVIHLGKNGNGLVMKLCHNSLVAQIQNGVNETMALAKKTADIDPLTYVKAISYGGGQNFYLDGKGPKIAEGDFKTAFSVENMNKDVHLTADLAKEVGSTTPGIDLVVSRYEEAMDKGYGKKDFSATYLLMD
jgi:3-hydroxyisobutyrate dehydrogenase